jgi:ubiquinone/menaquinone biosynthesis C-methylase UbiE
LVLREIYARRVFPRLLDRLLGNEEIGRLRRETLRKAGGKTLEIGFGTGLNLPYFPSAVTELIAIDSEVMMEATVAARLAAAPMPVRRLQIDAQGQLPFPEHSFDSVVTTFTLCSISNLAAALSEIRRVLKPKAPFIFLEHGRSDLPSLATWQDRLNPLQQIVGVGCNLNRHIDRLITDHGFTIEELERFNLPRAPRLIGSMYRGTARPS